MHRERPHARYAGRRRPRWGRVRSRTRRAVIVYDSSRLRTMSRGWGLLPGPGTAHVHEYRGCRDGRVVADVVRVDKGHTEGLEPAVTEALVELMVSAAGGKMR